MDRSQVVDLITSIIGAGGLAFICYMCTSINARMNRYDSIKSDLEEEEKDYDLMNRMAEYESINAPEEPVILDVENLSEDNNQ